jgi:hypothetical protein
MHTVLVIGGSGAQGVAVIKGKPHPEIALEIH